MNVTRTLLVTALMGVVALAGCADDPPTGEFSSDTHGLTLGSSTADISITPSENPYDPGQDPTGMIPFEEACALDQVTGNDPTGTAPQCQDARTEVSVHAMQLPDPGSGTYEAYLVGQQERLIGELTSDEAGMWTAEAVYEGEDLSGQFNATEIRYGDIVYATSGASSGSNNYERALQPAMFTVEYDGHELTMTVEGAPEGATLTGWLVAPDPESESEELEHLEDFPVTAGGPTTYTADRNIDEYDEVHIHIGDSKINLGIATVA